MGLTFKRQDNLDKLFDKFASVPDPNPKKAASGKGTEKEDDKAAGKEAK
ncbi:SPJ_0845 family protein [Lactobacillus delbrueckii]|nr:SPJ_0845 family protein [Lactobacillus delbrueckii]MDA3800564.1 SPJ_0845 family protein [Lactobacillus delbrueckii]